VVQCHVVGRHRFAEVGSHRLASLSASGLYARVRYSRDVPVWKAIAISVVVTLLIPVLRLLPSDISVWLFQKRANPSPGDGGARIGGQIPVGRI
jgi:hypothetical protein